MFSLSYAPFLEGPLGADAAAETTLLANPAVQVEVQRQVGAGSQLIAGLQHAAVALQGGSGSTIAVDGCFGIAAEFILLC